MSPRNIARSVRTSVRSGTSAPAVVIDVAGSKVSVRLSTRGAVYRNLNLVGGPVDIGDQVHVDFTTDEPTVVAPGRSYEADFEALEEAITPPITEAAEIEEFESGMIEVYQVGEWASSGSGGQWWKDPTAGSFFDATDANLDIAIGYAEPGSAIFLPRHEFGGNHAFWYGQTIIGYGQGETVLTGQITFRHDFYVRELSFVRSFTSSGTQGAVIVYGDGYFYQVDFTCINYGSGDSIGLYNDVMSSVLVFDECHFEADVGLWGNANGGYTGALYSNRFLLANWAGMPPWYVEYMGQGILRFHGEDTFTAGNWMVDGFRLILYSRLYDKDPSKVVMLWDCVLDWNNHGETNYYSSQDEDGHSFEDNSFWKDYGSPGSADPTKVPVIPVEDETVFTHKAGVPLYSSYAPGWRMQMEWTHQDHGLGADMSTGSAGDQSERTATNWGYQEQEEWTYYWLVRRMGDADSGSDARLQQDGYDLDLYLKYAWVQDWQGWKVWLAPNLFRAKLTRSSFDCGTYDVRAQYFCNVVVDPPTYGEIENYLGNIVLESNLGIPDFSATEPSDPYPGMLWYPMEDVGA